MVFRVDRLRVWGLGFWRLGCVVYVFRVFGLTVQGLGFRVHGLWCLESMGLGFGFLASKVRNSRLGKECRSCLCIVPNASESLGFRMV